jgi:SAM-dependent methyltransferase
MMALRTWWERLWAFTPGDPANRLHPRKYELLYQFEEHHWWFVGMRQIQRSLVPELYRRRDAHHLRVLDAGCGTGGRLRELPPTDLRVGVDLSHHALVYAQQRELVCLIQAPIERLPFHDESFDIVMSCDVLELVDDELKALEELRRICKANGILFLNLPAFHFLGGRHSQAVGMIRRYTRRSLQRLLAQAGLRIERITYTNCLLLPCMMLARLWSLWVPGGTSPSAAGVDFRRYPRWVNWILMRILVLESFLVRWVDLPVGSSVTVRAAR